METALVDAPCAGLWESEVAEWRAATVRQYHGSGGLLYIGVEREEEETNLPSDNLNNSTVEIIYLNAHLGYIKYIRTKCII